eukprot:m.77495 g.77495  ORF g.77495 m.77495 type:complete len:216 (+) comp12629_c0_seq1:1115-1762(+)
MVYLGLHGQAVCMFLDKLTNQMKLVSNIRHRTVSKVQKLSRIGEYFLNLHSKLGMDATSQIFAHFAQIALGTDKTARNTQQLNFSSEMLGRQVELYGLTEFSCVIGSMFWTDNNNNGRSYVLVNACPNAVQGVLAWNGAQTTSVNVNITSYEATQKFNSANHWVPLNQIENIMSPPWNNGPLQPFISSGKYYVRDGNVMNITLSALSLTIIQAKI